jgi:DNA-binding transcriptional MerR regulator
MKETDDPNFASIAIYTALQKKGFPIGEAVAIAAKVPDHTSPEFRGLDVEMQDAFNKGKQIISSRIAELESKAAELQQEVFRLQDQLAILHAAEKNMKT